MSITNMLSVANVTDQKREERTRKMSVIKIHIYVIQTIGLRLLVEMLHTAFSPMTRQTTETTLIGYLAVEIGRQSNVLEEVLEIQNVH